MKVFCLCENTPFGDGFAFEHGLSLFIQTQKFNILFDFGQSDAFLKNAKKLGVDLSKVDFAILSHGHYDHGNGLKWFFEENNNCKVYAHKDTFGNFFHREKYIGLDGKINKNRFFFLSHDLTLGEGVRILVSRENKFPLDDCDMWIGRKDIPDDFTHEIYLEIEEDGKKYLFSGCAHKGILNILDWFSPDYFFGGLHLSHHTPVVNNEKLYCIKSQLEKKEVKIYTGHCTGIEQFNYLKSSLPLEYISSGKVITIN